MRKARPDGGLADAGLADQHRVVLRAPGEHLDGAADFLVAADHRIELAVARLLRQVAGVFLQRIVGAFRRGRVGGAPLAQGLDRRVEVLRRDARLGENLPRLAVLLQSDREQQPLDRDVAVARLLGDLLGVVEQPRRGRRQVELAAGAAARNLRQLCQRRLDCLVCLARIAAGAVDQPGGKPLRVVEQDFENMFGRELLVPFAQRERLGGLDESAGAVGIFLDIHFTTP